MEQVWEESRHRIAFDDSWRVRAYDRGPWFRHVGGWGIKGVDFMGLREGRLYLVEVKNYAPVAGRPARPLPEAGQWVEDIDDKFADSRRMVGIVLAALRRHLLFRFWEWGAQYFPLLRRMEPEWSFWVDAGDAVAKERVVPVCWILGGPDPSSGAVPGHWMLLQGVGPFPGWPGVEAAPK